MWLNKFKIALIQKDAEAIDMLLNEVPKFDTKEDMEQAMFLMKEGVATLYTLQDEVVNSMRQIKKNINFLQSSLSDSQGSFSRKY